MSHRVTQQGEAAILSSCEEYGKRCHLESIGLDARNRQVPRNS